MRKFRFRNNDNGQSLVELALVLPVFLLVIFGIIQFGAILSSRVATTNAANEGVRMAAVGNSAPEVKDRVIHMTSSIPFLVVEPDSIEVWPEEPASRLAHGEVKVEFPATVEIVFPLLDILLGETLELHSSALMLYESGEYQFGEAGEEVAYIDVFNLAYDKPNDKLTLILAISDSIGDPLQGVNIEINLYRKEANDDILVPGFSLAEATPADGTIRKTWDNVKGTLGNGRYKGIIDSSSVKLMGSLESNYVNVN